MADELSEMNLLIVIHIKVLSLWKSCSVELKKSIEKEPLILDDSTVYELLYYFFSIISEHMTAKLLSINWPLTSFKTRAQFGVGVKKFVTWINAEWPEAQLRFVPSILITPVGIKLSTFLAKLSLLALKLEYRKKTSRSEHPLVPLDCNSAQKLLINQKEGIERRNSYINSRSKLKEEILKHKKMLMDAVATNSALNKIMEEKDELLNDVVDKCPSKYRTKLLSLEDYRTGLEEWSNDMDEMNKSNEKKLKFLDEFIPMCSSLSDKKASTSDITSLSADEVLSGYNRNLYETYAKKNQVSLFDNGKLSLHGVNKICKIALENVSSFANEGPPLNLSECQQDPDQLINELDSSIKQHTDHYNEVCKLKKELFERCLKLEKEMRERDEHNDPRRLSVFFESPQLTFDEIKNSPIFSSPGLTGPELLEVTRKQLKKADDLATCVNGTPILRKYSQIPRSIRNEVLCSDESARMEIKNKKEKMLKTSVLPAESIAVRSRPVIHSSTMCSESGRVAIDDLVEEPLSPFCLPSESVECSDNSSEDESSELPVCSSQHTPTKLQKREKTKIRPSLELIIEKYKKIKLRIGKEKDETM